MRRRITQHKERVLRRFMNLCELIQVEENRICIHERSVNPFCLRNIHFFLYSKYQFILYPIQCIIYSMIIKNFMTGQRSNSKYTVAEEITLPKPFHVAQFILLACNNDSIGCEVTFRNTSMDLRIIVIDMQIRYLLIPSLGWVINCNAISMVKKEYRHHF